VEILGPFRGGCPCHPDSSLPRDAHCISVDSHDDTKRRREGSQLDVIPDLKRFHPMASLRCVGVGATQPA
jgi:hypothetical protein